MTAPRFTPFKQIDVTRAVKGVTAAGLLVVGVKIERDGNIVILTTDGGQTAERNDWDGP